jgi:excinuclease ABC subunit B
VHGTVIMYADVLTGSIQAAIAETSRRRAIQETYNQEHGITPASIVKAIDEVLSSVYERDYLGVPSAGGDAEPFMSLAEIDARIQQLTRDMKGAAANLEFEKAAALRDDIKRLRARGLGVDVAAMTPGRVPGEEP